MLFCYIRGPLIVLPARERKAELTSSCSQGMLQKDVADFYFSLHLKRLPVVQAWQLQRDAIIHLALSSNVHAGLTVLLLYSYVENRHSARKSILEV